MNTPVDKLIRGAFVLVMRIEGSTVADLEELAGLVKLDEEYPVKHPANRGVCRNLKHVLRRPLPLNVVGVRRASEDAEKPIVRPAETERPPRFVLQVCDEWGEARRPRPRICHGVTL